MINELRKGIINILKVNGLPFTSRVIDPITIYLLYLKYLCEKGKFKYDEVIYSNKIYDIIYLPKLMTENLNKCSISVNSLLNKIQNLNAKDLTEEFIKSCQNDFHFLKADKKIMCLIGRSLPTYYVDVCIYDMFGKTIYTTLGESFNKLYEYFKAFDEILGIHNEYQDINEVDYGKYDSLYIYDNLPKYYKLKNSLNLFDYMYMQLPKVNNIILYSKYSKVSNFKEGGTVAKFIKTIIIKNNNIMIIFNKDAKEISIINGDNPKITKISDLIEIINNNRKQKDVLTKTNYDELKKNNLRIGFNLYQMEKNEDKIDINKIVDENTEYLKRLNELNDVVEVEINDIFNL